MYTSKLKIKTFSMNVWRSLCWWPDLSDYLVTSSISQGWPQKKPADHNCRLMAFLFCSVSILCNLLLPFHFLVLCWLCKLTQNVWSLSFTFQSLFCNFSYFTAKITRQPRHTSVLHVSTDLCSESHYCTYVRDHVIQNCAKLYKTARKLIYLHILILYIKCTYTYKYFAYKIIDFFCTFSHFRYLYKW